MARLSFHNAKLVLPDEILPNAGVVVVGERIASITTDNAVSPDSVDLHGAYLAPGFIELHVHGGDGADFMDLTPEAFRTVACCHARHGTTTMTPTSTVAAVEQYTRFLKICWELRGQFDGGSRIHGGHLYGPYFLREAKGCHPNATFLTPEAAQDESFLDYAGTGLTTLTVAPELPDAERLVRAACDRGLLVTAGHSYATFTEMERAVAWGVRHVDHLFCAMSDRARLRQHQSFPMRGGVLEATLYFDELTTEVIADGHHLTGDLLRLAYKVKGPDRLALVTDTMRAMDCPDGEYWFGPPETGERVRRLGDIGVTLDGKSLASGVMGMDHGVRTFHRLTGAPLHEVIRMASLTPARILGIEQDYGSLEVGKVADLVVLDEALNVQQVYIAGQKVV